MVFLSISHYAPVKGGGEGLPLAEQDLIAQRWAIYWRSVTLSAFGKTIYPYCRHLRYLDLRDLDHLLSDDKFRGQIAKHFFKDELARFHFVMQTPSKVCTTHNPKSSADGRHSVWPCETIRHQEDHHRHCQ